MTIIYSDLEKDKLHTNQNINNIKLPPSSIEKEQAIRKHFDIWKNILSDEEMGAMTKLYEDAVTSPLKLSGNSKGISAKQIYAIYIGILIAMIITVVIYFLNKMQSSGINEIL
ncbi:MAG: hypothetical protein ACD_3C00207G0004 [uncultured bacterium (gcode 4)]|uniref:Uncharacterized protein n=1 Tax=uncultured bacterium (gcode 4) TaxID=1234023 RepID=K2GB70_9BACT|nr:MAG: hypothetical protein ACD_3C00207G0004 [uncultured bacterium (gcode 4)]